MSAALAVSSRAGSLILDMAAPAGAATPLSGANWDGSQIVGNNYGANFKDFQFNLASSPDFTFSDFTAIVNASAQNKAANGTMGITVWAGPIVASPVFSNALATFTVSSTNWSGNNNFEYVNFGPATNSSPVTVTTIPDIFFLRVWGTGVQNVSGWKAKFKPNLQVAYATNVAPSLIVTNYDGTNTAPAPTFNYTGPLPPDPQPDPEAAVPEPGTWAMAGLLVLAAGYMRWRRRAVAV